MGFNSLPLESLLWVTLEALFWAKQFLSYFRPAHSTTWLGLYQQLVRVWSKKEKIVRLVSACAATLGKIQKLWVMIIKPQLYSQILRHQNWNRGGCYMLSFWEKELKLVIFEFVVQMYKCQRSWIILESDKKNLSLLTKLKKCKPKLEISLMVWFVYTLIVSLLLFCMTLI